MENEINSIDKIMEKRRKRQGYDSDMPMSMHKKLTLKQFLSVTNPFVVFIDFNQIKLSEEDKENYCTLVPMPEGLDEYLDDLQVLGKREIQMILKVIRLNKMRRRQNIPEASFQLQNRVFAG